MTPSPKQLIATLQVWHRHCPRPCLDRQRLVYGLWFTAWLLVAALTVRGSEAWLTPKDNLLALAPDSTISYLHLNRPSAANLDGLMADPASLPTDPTPLPTEAARLVLPQADTLTEPTVVTWLLNWTDTPPDPKTWLADQTWQASGLGNRTWLVWPQASKINYGRRLATIAAAGRTLDRYPGALAALKQARRLADRQWLLIPGNRALTPDQPNNPMWLAALPSLVGASNQPDLVYLHIWPLQPPAIEPWPAIANPNTKQIVADFRPADSLASLNGTAGLLNWPPLILSRINRWRLAAGLDPVPLPEADALHSGPVAVSLLPASDRPGLGTHILLHGAKLTEIADRLSNYLDTVLPTRTVTVLPDKDQVTELLLKPGNNRFLSTEQPGTLFLWNRPADLKLYLTDHPAGVVLSNLAWEAPINENELNLRQCERTAGNRVIIRDEYLEFLNYLAGFKAESNDSFRLFIEKSSNLWISCRLNPRNVDN